MHERVYLIHFNRLSVLNIKQKLRIIVITVMLAMVSFGSIVLAADGDPDTPLGGLDTAKNGAPSLAGSGSTDLPTIIGTLIGYALSFIGVLFLCLMLYGGFLWMTDMGNEKKVTEAKNLITAAVIGFIIVMSAYAITSFVSGSLIK
ncbi:MAG: hypothetical protein NT091_00725 [Candidatus Falkowbacteria bacterium]|nr:hypothetical protein [Candidatus Falkowbacteria bacterium]